MMRQQGAIQIDSECGEWNPTAGTIIIKAYGKTPNAITPKRLTCGMLGHNNCCDVAYELALGINGFGKQVFGVSIAEKLGNDCEPIISLQKYFPTKRGAKTYIKLLDKAVKLKSIRMYE